MNLADLLMASSNEGMPGFDTLPLRESADADAKRLQRMAIAAGASAPDVFGIPSALLGIVSPEMRDDWRSVQQQEGMGPQMVGAAAGGVAALPRILGAIGGGALRSAGVLGGGAASADVLDEYAGGVDDAVGKGTLAKMLLGSAAVTPLRYAAPMAAGGGTILGMESEAAAQGVDRNAVAARMRAMRPDQVRAFQAANGLRVDGQAGPETVGKAIEMEMAKAARNSVEAEQGRIRAQGEADAAREAARIKAEAEARGIEAEKASELKGKEARRPFVERNPEYSTYAPWLAGAAAAAIPVVSSLLTRRAATAPARQAAGAVDDAMAAYKAAPSPIGARTAATAADDYATAAAARPASPTALDRGLDAATVGTAAMLPTAAVMMPNVIDYAQQSPDSPAYKQAAEQFTVDKMLERLWGPTSMGMILAGSGRLAGDKTAAAMINPAPKGANLAEARTLGQMLSDGAPTAGQTSAVARRLGSEMSPITIGTASAPAAPGVLTRVEDAFKGTPRFRAQRAEDEATMLAAQRGRQQEQRLLEQSQHVDRRAGAVDAEVVQQTSAGTGASNRGTLPKPVSKAAAAEPDPTIAEPVRSDRKPGQKAPPSPASQTNQPARTSPPPENNASATVSASTDVVKTPASVTVANLQEIIPQQLQRQVDVLNKQTARSWPALLDDFKGGGQELDRAVHSIVKQAIGREPKDTEMAAAMKIARRWHGEQKAGGKLAVPGAISAGGAVALSADKADAIGREVEKRMVAGQDIGSIRPADISKVIGMSEDEIAPEIARLSRRAGTLDNGRTRVDQLRAIKDRSSPTGHRDEMGRFAPAP
ncbi:MAG: peptidoglycan-binding protein [Desulfurellales bacterium]|nr:MAG: peptidoglycan-binding protein [Desulfurellales bacterium]